jgi:hypothetical protein
MRRLFPLALLFTLALGSAALAGCSSDGEPADGPPEGYTRFRTPPITVQPGESGQWIQWVSAPLERDMDVVDVVGSQTAGGHHALLYMTPESNEIGFTREFLNEDQLSTRILGGVGGEAGASVPLPPGTVFRVKAGNSLMIQVHYLNTTDEPIQGEAVLDAKITEVDPEAQVASWFFNATIGTDVAPGQSTARVTCVLPEDVTLIMFANHMHETGAHAETREARTDGTTVDVKIDPAWNYEWALNPNFAFMTSGPLVLSAGSTLTTDCAWNNQGGDTLSFPDEMCIFFGIRLGEGDRICADGSWIN